LTAVVLPRPIEPRGTAAHSRHHRCRHTRRALSGSSAGPRAAYSFELSQQRCGQLEEQVEQQQKIIRYLQAQLHDAQKGAAAGSPKAPPQQQPQSARALQQECAGLRQQLEALRLAPGAPAQQQQQQQQQCASDSTAAPAALQQQVLSLQVRRRC
jgi:hypothetical protein